MHEIIYHKERPFVRNENGLYSKGLVAVTQEPIRRSIVYYDSMRFLSFPKVLFLIKYKYFKADAVKPSLKDLEDFDFRRLYFAFIEGDNLYYPSLTNIEHNLEVCIKHPSVTYQSLNTMISGVINHFWNSQFNNDITTFCKKYNNSSTEPRRLLGNYTSWESLTKQDKEWVPNKEIMIPWRCGEDPTIFPVSISDDLKGYLTYHENSYF